MVGNVSVVGALGALDLGGGTLDNFADAAAAQGAAQAIFVVNCAEHGRGIKRAKAEGKYKGRVPTAMRQANKVKALVEAGVQRVQVQEQLGISKASFYRCLSG